MRNSQSITDLREGGPASLTASPTSSISAAGGDSPSTVRTWGTTKDRGKIRLDQSYRLFRSLDVTTNTASAISSPVQVDRLTDSPSPPPIAPTPYRWSSESAYYSLPHSSLWSTTFEDEDEDASLSSDSLDPSTSSQPTMGVPSAADISSPSPPPGPTPRKRWQSPATTPRPSLLDVSPIELAVANQQEEELHPRFVCWELPFTPHRSGPAKPWVRVQPRMRSELNPPAAHKCDLKAHRRCKPRSRPSSRERGAATTTGSNGPDSMPDMSIRSSAKSKWTRRVGVQQLLPSKARFSCSSLDVRADAQSGRGTPFRAKTRNGMAKRRAPHEAGNNGNAFSKWILFGMKNPVFFSQYFRGGKKHTHKRWRCILFYRCRP